MIELASLTEILALKYRWEMEQKQYRTDPPKYTESRQAELQRIADDYKASEEKHQAKRPRAKARADKEREENERWNKIYEERIEDKSYYGGLNVTYARNWDV